MITLIIGDVGSGKTLLMCLFSLLSNRKVFTNFKIKDKDKKIGKFAIKHILDEKIQSSDVFIDEFYLYMDSRKFMSDINALLSYFAFQSRKLDLSIYLSTQIIRTIDIRMREMIDNVIECEKVVRNGKLIGFSYSIFANINTSNGGVKRLFLSLKNAIPYFSKYDTYQIIKTPLFESIKRNVAVSEYTEIEITEISRQCIKYLKKVKLKTNKTNIGIFCIKNNYSNQKQFINSLYAETTIIKASMGK